MVFVRDTVTLRAGTDERPYIGKIAAIWRERGIAFVCVVFNNIDGAFFLTSIIMVLCQL